MRVFLLLALVACTYATSADVTAVRAKLGDFWNAAADGDADKYHSFFSSKLEVVTNGEPDQAPWTDVKFVKDLFSKVRYSDVVPSTPVAKAEDGTYFVTIDWSVTMMSTGQELKMGPWAQQFGFDADGKINKIVTVCDGVSLENFGKALAPPADLRALLQKYLDGWNTADPAKMIAATHPKFYLTRNNQEDRNNWRDPSFLGKFFEKGTWKFTIEDIAITAPEFALANIAVEITPTGKDPVHLMEGWYVQYAYNDDDEVVSVGSIISIVDSHALYEGIAAFYK